AAVVALAGLAMARASTFLVENPIRERRWGFAVRPRRVLWTAGACVLIIAALGGAEAALAQWKLRSTLVPASSTCSDSHELRVSTNCVLARGRVATVYIL